MVCLLWWDHTKEYKPHLVPRFSGWKVGHYEVIINYALQGWQSHKVTYCCYIRTSRGAELENTNIV